MKTAANNLLKSVTIKNKSVVFQAVLGVLVFILLVLLIPQTRNAMRMSRLIAEKRKTLQDVEYWTKNFAELELQRRAEAAEHNTYLSRLPKQKEFAVILEHISNIARQNNVKITAMEPRRFEDEPHLFYVRIPILIEAVSGYHELGKFINELEFGEKLIRIADLRVRSDAEDARRHAVLLTVYGICLKEPADTASRP